MTAGNQVGADFWSAVLADIGAPDTANNEANLERWSTFENTLAQENPLATTQGSGSVFNSAGVKDFSTAAQGEQATAATLLNGYYPDIVSELRASAPLGSWDTPSVIHEINTWGTHGFANYISGGGTQGTTPPATSPSSSASSSGGTAPSAAPAQPGGVSGAIGSAFGGWIAGLGAWIGGLVEGNLVPLIAAFVLVYLVMAPRLGAGGPSGVV